MACGDMSFKKAPLKLPIEFSFLNKPMTTEEISSIEEKTRLQSKSEEWFSHRKGRITSSNFGKVIKRKKKATESFKNTVFNRGALIFANSVQYGKKKENSAKQAYLEKFPSRHIHDCGFVVNNEFSFLGASPDGKVCDGGKCGLLG